MQVRQHSMQICRASRRPNNHQWHTVKWGGVDDEKRREGITQNHLETFAHCCRASRLPQTSVLDCTHAHPRWSDSPGCDFRRCFAALQYSGLRLSRNPRRWLCSCGRRLAHRSCTLYLSHLGIQIQRHSALGHSDTQTKQYTETQQHSDKTTH